MSGLEIYNKLIDILRSINISMLFSNNMYIVKNDYDISYSNTCYIDK